MLAEEVHVGGCFVPQTNPLSCVSAVSAHVVGEDEAVMKAASAKDIVLKIWHSKDGPVSDKPPARVCYTSLFSFASHSNWVSQYIHCKCQDSLFTKQPRAIVQRCHLDFKLTLYAISWREIELQENRYVLVSFCFL